MRSTHGYRNILSYVCPSSNFSQHFRAVGHDGADSGDASGIFSVPVLNVAVVSPDTRMLSNVTLEGNLFCLIRRRDI